MINIAILGRPNVGKSTLFNRFAGRRKSIVDPMAGVTRDISIAKTYIDDIEFNVFDTGGLLDVSDDTLNEKVREKALKTALEDSDILLFLVDAHQSHPDDRHFINIIRKSGKPIILVINKVDADSHNNLVSEFYSLGIKDVSIISAEHNNGIDDLKEKILEVLEKKGFDLEAEREITNNSNNDDEDDITEIEDSEYSDEDFEEEYNEENPNDKKDKSKQYKLDEYIAQKKTINIAIVGKPNAGKSTLLNTLIGKDRSIVSNIAGTTRDAIDETFNFKGDDICLVDTAGIRKKKNVNTDVEYYSVNRAIKAIEASDVCILMLDVFEGLTDQDKTIANLIIERRKGIVIAANKWDIREKGTTWNDYEAYMKDAFPVLNYAFYARVCANRKNDAEKLLSLAVRVAKTRMQRFETHALTETMVRATREYSISAGGNPFKIFYVVQTGVNPPAFAVFCNHPHKLNSHYKRYLENRFREMFDFRGTPIILNFRKRGKKFGG
ncbi:ribosome biogenesis GTPase Der [Brachyspira hyodysenteriae]|uniref:ribosome biogenesis GTPase Der n=1 Tax=Brachyspira hyodysenteriae TaxID=159 RepID=UPI0022CD5A91|nr:ribosome biogenesis GTPase Der [Brachyspira hyodysenteriae]MCZ9838261.1 ribosome biogenesis GTPase Der [Brachyspira hyodysenteriae]MCZ9849372.1 ribosome biogenesis GTPase Der [Brachyspira hyodysenteriae]MCZ9850339.1 ribosome biogenesis GTPase Der [Brachyspira hyodysenteriae]MCZ9860908.1 ribosome biogenesis GTPase Der [Brachyspira hyodysenteriae]MCZ9870825.1 ribosome biogenesis GTPase Der [Brachyspira hyodysenteriae]